MASKRIKDLTERTTISSGDFLATDNSNGTRKVDASKIMTPISTAQSTADLVTDKVSGSGDAFSSSKGYSVGDLVIAPYDNLIYRCKTAYSTGASWASRKTNFEHVTLVDAVSDLNDALMPLFKEQDLSNSASIAYPNSASIEINITIPTGYRLFTYAWNNNAIGASTQSLVFSSNTNKFTFYVKNISGGTITCGINLKVIYIREGGYIA